MYAIECDDTREVIAWCPDRATAEIVRDRIGGRLTVREGAAAMAQRTAPYASTEWARAVIRGRDGT